MIDPEHDTCEICGIADTQFRYVRECPAEVSACDGCGFNFCDQCDHVCPEAEDGPWPDIEKGAERPPLPKRLSP